MEPAADRLGDRRAHGVRRVSDLATMEPAEDRLGEDGKPVQTTPPNTPQWSQPRIGRVTTAVGTLNYINWTPQWSQPRIGWVTVREI